MGVYIDSLMEKAAATDLLQDCWRTSPPEGQQPASERELTWFRDHVERDACYRGLATPERAALVEAALALEREVPVIRGDGDPLPAPHRLYVAFELAKVLRARPRTTLELLRSVVLYADAGKLRKHTSEAGLVYYRGRSHLVRILGMLERLWAELVPAAKSVAGALPTGKTRNLPRRFEAVARELADWRTRLEAQPDGGDPAGFAEFVARIAEEPVALLQRLRGAWNLEGDGGLAEAIRSAIGAVEQLGAQLATHRETASLENMASIHVSWFAQMTCTRTAHHNVLVHELAHVIDFEHGGLDGTPEAALRDGWQRAFEAATSEAGDAAAPPIDRYGLTNASEFFAVATEHFFSEASSLAKGAPALHELLEQTYGYVPADRIRTSAFGMFRALFLSKLRLF